MAIEAAPVSPVTRPICTIEPVLCRTRSGIATYEKEWPRADRVWMPRKMR
ncbi:hypothetical protein GCM10009837_10120 [Streptomyces durmitorensis]